MKKKRNDSIFNIVITLIVILLGVYGIVSKKMSLKKSGETICKIVDIRSSPGRGARSEKLFFEYYVNGNPLIGEEFLPSKYKVQIGDCYNMKYSIIKPKVTDILFEKGKISCEKLDTIH